MAVANPNQIKYYKKQLHTFNFSLQIETLDFKAWSGERLCHIGRTILLQLSLHTASTL
jgi:hypothetical protein